MKSGNELNRTAPADHHCFPPEGLIKCDDWGDTMSSCMLTDKHEGGVYARAVTGIHVNYGHEHDSCLAWVITLVYKLHHS